MVKGHQKRNKNSSGPLNAFLLKSHHLGCGTHKHYRLYNANDPNLEILWPRKCNCITSLLV